MGMQLHLVTLCQREHCRLVSDVVIQYNESFYTTCMTATTAATIETSIAAPTIIPNLHIYEAHKFSKVIGTFL